MKKTLIYSLLFIKIMFAQNSGNTINADPLAETPLYPIPSEMTFEEYQDMNRIFCLKLKQILLSL